MWVWFAGMLGGCTTVDPGPNFVVPDEHFDEDYFYCHVEPELLFAKHCGSGDPGDNGNCHFNASAVSGMALRDHPAVDCGGGDHPLSRAAVGAGSPAQGNLQAATLSGVKVKSVVFWIFVNMGVLSALAGIIFAGRLNQANPTAGNQ